MRIQPFSLQAPDWRRPLAAAPASEPVDTTLLTAANLLGERVRPRWNVSVGGPPTAASPTPDGQAMLLEVGGKRLRVGVGGHLEPLPDLPVSGSRQSRAALLADGSEVVFSWDTHQRGAQSFDHEAIQLSRLQGGQVLWTRDLGVSFYQSSESPISWPPVAMPNGSFLMAHHGVECRDAAGNQLWSCPGEAYGNFAVMPSVAGDGTAYIVQNYLQGGLYGSQASRLHGYRPDGTHWQKSVAPMHCSPAISQDGGAIVAYGSRLEKLSPEGKSVWQRPLEGRLSAVLEEPDGNLLLCQSDRLRCYDPLNDRDLWSVPLSSPPVGLPVRLGGGDLLLATRDGKVTCLADNMRTSRPVLPTGGGVQESGGGWVVVGGVRVPRRR